MRISEYSLLVMIKEDTQLDAGISIRDHQHVEMQRGGAMAAFCKIGGLSDAGGMNKEKKLPKLERARIQSQGAAASQHSD
mmetsp:Transcript_121082/g.241192  ORF Transcript_121082/g.241192 Transcript_121082/m.241192 type:complete len:80 (+) Transcript_121082:217-456(+)